MREELLDITSAGHLLAGEKPEDGVRELEEELGLSVSFADLHVIDVIRDVTGATGFVDKELCHVFAYECARPLHEYSVQEEVTGLFWVKLDEVVKLFSGETPTIGAYGFLVREDGTNKDVHLDVDQTAFVPHEEHYYRRVFDEVKRLASVATDGI